MALVTHDNANLAPVHICTDMPNHQDMHVNTQRYMQLMHACLALQCICLPLHVPVGWAKAAVRMSAAEPPLTATTGCALDDRHSTTYLRTFATTSSSVAPTCTLLIYKSTTQAKLNSIKHIDRVTCCDVPARRTQGCEQETHVHTYTHSTPCTEPAVLDPHPMLDNTHTTSHSPRKLLVGCFVHKHTAQHSTAQHTAAHVLTAPPHRV